MAKVQIFRGEHLEQEVPLGTRAITLGRNPEGDIVLDHSSISRKHATLGFEGGRLVLRDAGSTNGIYLGKEKVESWEAVEGQAAELGVFTLRVVELAAAVPVEPEREPEQRTRIISRSAEAPRFTTPEQPAPAAAILVTKGPDGSEKTYRLAGKALTVGRGKECDICFDDRQVSRLHARVFADGDVWKISDMESVNGIFLNDVRVQEAELTPGATITIGSCTLTLATGTKQGQSPPQFQRPGLFNKLPSRRTGIIAAIALVVVVGGVVAFNYLSGIIGAPPPKPASPQTPSATRAPEASPTTTPSTATTPATPSPSVAPTQQESSTSIPAIPDASTQTAVAPVVVPPIPRAPAAPVTPRSTDPGVRPAANSTPTEKPAVEDKVKARQNIQNNAERATAEGDCGTVRTSARAMDALDSRSTSQEARAVRKLLGACDAREKVRAVLADASAAENAGAWDKAQSSYQMVLSMDPGNIDAKRGLDAIAAADGGRKSRIKDCFQKAEIFESIGEMRDATRLWQEILSLAPDPKDPDNRTATTKIEKYRGLAR